jgi:membrane-associated PAP2 superfamily phosphatase
MRSNNGGRTLTAVFLLLVLCSGLLGGPMPPVADSQSADEAEDPGRTATLGRFIMDFAADTVGIWSAPFRLKTRDTGPLIVFAAATTFLIAGDEDIRRGVKSYAEAHGWVHDVGTTVTQMGGWGAFATAGIFLGVGLVFKEERARDTGTLAASALAQSFLVSAILKGLTGRRRPYCEDGSDRWAGPAGFFKRYEKANEGLYDSFPSGHAAAAFSLATVVALQYRHHPWVPVVAYTLAAGVGLSRMTEDRHWASDVLVGAVIGHLVARLVVHNHDKRRRLVPVLGCARRSIIFGFQFAREPDHRTGASAR